jgi:hypothetical protein
MSKRYTHVLVSHTNTAHTHAPTSSTVSTSASSGRVLVPLLLLPVVARTPPVAATAIAAGTIGGVCMHVCVIALRARSQQHTKSSRLAVAAATRSVRAHSSQSHSTHTERVQRCGRCAVRSRAFSSAHGARETLVARVPARRTRPPCAARITCCLRHIALENCSAGLSVLANTGAVRFNTCRAHVNTPHVQHSALVSLVMPTLMQMRW